MSDDVRVKLHPNQIEFLLARRRARCRGFQWIGQAFEHCDGCGRDLRDHDGVEVLRPGAGPFAPEWEIVPFDEAARRMPLFAIYCTPLDLNEPMRWETPS